MSDKANENKIMTETERVIEELYELESTKSCCQKAFLCGLLYPCVRVEEKKEYQAFFYRLREAEKAAEIIDGHFSALEKTEIFSVARGGHKGYALNFRSKALSSVFLDIDNRRKDGIDNAVGFRCADCKQHFLKGVFMSSATLSRPKSGYHLEFSITSEPRATYLEKMLAEDVCAPGKISRGKRIGLYYKSNVKISDLLYCLGAPKFSFEMTNISIERDIRNNENRATNCVTRNISRSVGATMKQIDAVNFLMETDKITMLGEELEYTARLRMENDSASLSELASLHEPPISKSGLNARLAKILAIAEQYRTLK